MSDEIVFGVLSGWGIWPEGDAAKSAPEELGNRFADQIGAGEAVEYSEVFELIRNIAWSAYENGRLDGVRESR